MFEVATYILLGLVSTVCGILACELRINTFGCKEAICYFLAIGICLTVGQVLAASLTSSPPEYLYWVMMVAGWTIIWAETMDGLCGSLRKCIPLAIQPNPSWVDIARQTTPSSSTRSKGYRFPS